MNRRWNRTKCLAVQIRVEKGALKKRFTSVQFSLSVMSDSLRPHGLQLTRLPCPSSTPRACSNSCPSSQWCCQLSHPLSSLSPPTFNLSQHQGLFHLVHSMHQVAKVLELQHQSFQWIFRIDFLLDWLVGSPCSPRDSQEFYPTPQFKSINFSAFFMVQLSHLYMTTGKTIVWLGRPLLAK